MGVSMKNWRKKKKGQKQMWNMFMELKENKSRFKVVLTSVSVIIYVFISKIMNMKIREGKER